MRYFKSLVLTTDGCGNEFESHSTGWKRGHGILECVHCLLFLHPWTTGGLQRDIFVTYEIDLTVPCPKMAGTGYGFMTGENCIGGGDIIPCTTR